MSDAGSMPALVLYGPGDLRLERVAIPEPPEGWVLLEVAWCGVCGSDIPRIFLTGAHRHPIVPGHEFAGVIARVGSGVAGWKEGDPATVFPLLWCGACHACEAGRYALCSRYDYLGSRRDGAFARYVLCPARNLRRVPKGVPLEHAAMTEPASVALHAVRRAAADLSGASVAVFGAGPIGLMTAQWARILGAHRVFVLDIVEERLALARRLGFQDVCSVADRAGADLLMERTGGAGVDVCFEAAGVPATFEWACRAVASGGRVVVLGNPSGDVTLPRSTVSQILRKEAVLQGIWNSDFRLHDPRDDWQTALDAMADGRLVVGPLISHRVALEEAPGTLRDMFERKGIFHKVLIGGCEDRHRPPSAR